MSKENTQENHSDPNDEDEISDSLHKPWDYPELSQNRVCCSPADEIEAMENQDENSSGMHSVEVQTDKSTLLLLKQDKKIDISIKKNNIQIINNKQPMDKKLHITDNSNSRQPNQTHEFEKIKLKKTGLNYNHEKVQVNSVVNTSTSDEFNKCVKTDLEPPTNYAIYCDESHLDNEKKDNISTNELLCVEEGIEEEKVALAKPKAVNKETMRNKKEIFSNTSKSFKEIFNFFKDRDKKRSGVENTKVSSPDSVKILKTPEVIDQKLDKPTQSNQSPIESSEKDSRSKNDTQCSQQTPLMFSRCSSMSSLNGFEQNSIHDDRSSIISDVSRRTSGVVSPSELPDSPAQMAPPTIKSQLKTQISCFGKKRINLPQDKQKANQSTVTSDNSLQIDIHKKSLVAKHSVFEDNITSFKDESTPTKLYSVAASSLSSLTIDDDDDYELINKIILNKDKQIVTEDGKTQNNRQEPIGKSNLPTEPDIKLNKTCEPTSEEFDEALNEEKKDELTDLTPYEEQLLDECIRRGIAKWTKQNINEIKPFSWDIELSCRASKAILTSRIRFATDVEMQCDNDKGRQIGQRDKCFINNNAIFEENLQNDTEDHNNCEYSNEVPDTNNLISNQEDTHNPFIDNSCYVTYEEHLLDECIRKGMAKITKRNINAIKPFSWDTNQICLTTRAMMLHGRDDNIHGSH